MSAPILIALPNSFITTVGIADIKQEPGDSGGSSTSRKRRLDHLSWDEKLQRKKMKNRVAAQTSRDRKKAKMDEMEFRIQKLETANVMMSKEMANLKAVNQRLAGENETLKSELTVTKAVGVAGVVARADQTGPAESFPRQQEVSARSAAPAALTRLMMLYLLCRTSSFGWTPVNTSIVLSNLRNPFSQKLIREVKEQIKINPNGLIQEVLQQKWWGPHQSMWNPVKIEEPYEEP